jgi:hypothetical protein
VRILRTKRLYNLDIKPLSGPGLLHAQGDLKTVVGQALALLPKMANYDKVRREMARVNGAWASFELTSSGALVLVTIVWTELEPKS